MTSRSKNKTVLVSRFPEAKRAASAFVHDAIRKAVDDGEHEAEKRLDRVNDKQGYNLPTEVEQDVMGHDGKITYDYFFGKFFEYGAVHLPASPFMRPAHRKMKKRFREEMADNFEGFIRRRASVSKSR